MGDLRTTRTRAYKGSQHQTVDKKQVSANPHLKIALRMFLRP